MIFKGHRAWADRETRKGSSGRRIKDK